MFLAEMSGAFVFYFDDDTNFAMPVPANHEEQDQTARLLEAAMECCKTEGDLYQFADLAVRRISPLLREEHKQKLRTAWAARRDVIDEV